MIDNTPQLPIDPTHAIEISGLSKHFYVSNETKTGKADKFWALNDISFDVNKGEILGIIGINGSGKSTLLRILSGISKPTKGSYRRQAKIGTLLDLSAGYHPDLTGLENLYLHGSVMGLSRDEITRRIPQIIGFAGLTRGQLENPVRHYSSGMVTRLGFSLAVNVDADILLIDETLSVGDIEFQAKSAGKIMEFIKQGKTLVLVSHIVTQIRHLCNRCVWLHQGKLLEIGPTDVVAVNYANMLRTLPNDSIIGHSRPSAIDKQDSMKQKGYEIVKVTAPETPLNTHDPMDINIDYICDDDVDSPMITVNIFDPFNQMINARHYELRDDACSKGQHRLSIRFKELPLAGGKYTLSVTFGRYKHDFPMNQSAVTLPFYIKEQGIDKAPYAIVLDCDFR